MPSTAPTRSAARYPIRVVARMTGLGLDTLRAWERRYQAVAPRRGDRGRRYNDAHVERLTQLARLVEQGHSIGTVAKLTSTELRSLLDAAPGTARRAVARPTIEIAPVTRAMKQYDLAAVEALLNRHAVVLPADALVFDVVLPMLREAGARWQAGTLRPAQEHLVSAVIRSVLGGLLRTLPRRPDGPLMVFATLSGERHELGLLCAAVLAAHAGHAVVYFGPELPAADLIHATTALKASTIVLAATATTSTSLKEARALRRLRPDVELWVGGTERASLSTVLGTRVRAIDSLDELSRLLDRRG